jgi:hypothetical protein
VPRTFPACGDSWPHSRDRGRHESIRADAHIDSYGTFVIHGLRQRLSENQQMLALVVPEDGLMRRAIELVGFAKVLPIKEELPAAMRAVSQLGL